MKKKGRFCALLLALSLLLSACSGLRPFPLSKNELRGTLKTVQQENIKGETEQAERPAEDQPDNPRNAAKPIVPFSEIRYERPDMERIRGEFAALTELLNAEADPEAIIRQVEICEGEYFTFYTAYALAGFLAYRDMTDPAAGEEYDFCEACIPEIEQLTEQMYMDCADASCAETLERDYFGEGFIDYYGSIDGVYTDEVYMDLLDQEAELLAEYRALTADPMIEYRGKTVSYYELIEGDLTDLQYYAAQKIYYQTYGPLIAEVYLKLLAVRNAIAERLGYDSYAEYVFAEVYYRDYTQEEANEMVQAIRDEIVPLYRETIASGLWESVSYTRKDETWLSETVGVLAAELGGDVAETWEFLNRYDLYDFSSSPKKAAISFEDYLDDYEAPFILAKTYGYDDDIFTVIHEFGHSADAYLNYNETYSLDLSETFSQGMEYLLLCSEAALPNEAQRRELTKLKLLDTLEVLAQQSSFHEFERRAFELAESERTLEKLCEISLETAKEFGYYEEGDELYYKYSWIDIVHFFEYPFYVISYCTSCSAAFRFFEMEREKLGSGVEAYQKLLPRDYDDFRVSLRRQANMENPLSEKSIRALAETIRELLEIG